MNAWNIWSIIATLVLTSLGIVLTIILTSARVIVALTEIKTKVDAMWAIFLKRIDGPP